MNIIQNIKKWVRRNSLELTPRGECLARYCNSLTKGNENHIEAYDQTIYYIKSLLEEKYHTELSFNETAELMSSYFSDYFDIG